MAQDTLNPTPAAEAPDTIPMLLEDMLAFASTGETQTVLMRPSFSNAPVALPPEKGFPYGGLLAAFCLKSMREGLGIEVPLQTLTVQYLAAARFGELLEFKPSLLRKGRQVSFATTIAAQGDRLTHNASATFGARTPDAPALYDFNEVPPPVQELKGAPGMEGPMVPRFASHVEYRFVGGPNIFGGNAERARVERCWMRMRDGKPADELRLCYLLDALYPPSWTGFRTPPHMTSVDLRYDFLSPITPENAPDGWIFFEYRLIQHYEGWALDDAVARGADGSVLAIARQHRKVL